MLVLGVFNDGKGKYQSAEMVMRELDDEYYNLDFSSIIGYGYDEELALEDFTNRFEELYSEITEFRKKLITRTCEIYNTGYNNKILDSKEKYDGELSGSTNKDIN